MPIPALPPFWAVPAGDTLIQFAEGEEVHETVRFGFTENVTFWPAGSAPPWTIEKLRVAGDTETTVEVGVAFATVKLTRFEENELAFARLQSETVPKHAHSCHDPMSADVNWDEPVHEPLPFVAAGKMPPASCPAGVQSCAPFGWTAQRLRALFSWFEARFNVHVWPMVKLPVVNPLIVSDALGVTVTGKTVSVTVTTCGVKVGLDPAVGENVTVPVYVPAGNELTVALGAMTTVPPEPPAPMAGTVSQLTEVEVRHEIG